MNNFAKVFFALTFFAGSLSLAGGEFCRGAFAGESALRFVRILAERRILTAKDLELIVKSPHPVNPFDFQESTPPIVNYRAALNKELEKIGDWNAFRKSLEKEKKEFEWDNKREESNRERTRELPRPEIIGKFETKSDSVGGASPLFLDNRHYIFLRDSKNWIRLEVLSGSKPLIEKMSLGHFAKSWKMPFDSVASLNGRVYHIRVDYKGLLQVADWTDAKNPIVKDYSIPSTIEEVQQVIAKGGRLLITGSNEGDAIRSIVELDPTSNQAPQVREMSRPKKYSYRSEFVETDGGFVSILLGKRDGLVELWQEDGQKKTLSMNYPKLFRNPSSLSVKRVGEKIYVFGTTVSGQIARWIVSENSVSAGQMISLKEQTSGYIETPILMADNERAVLLMRSEDIPIEKFVLVDWTGTAAPHTVEIEISEGAQGYPSMLRVGSSIFIATSIENYGIRIYEVLKNSETVSAVYEAPAEQRGRDHDMITWPFLYRNPNNGDVFINGVSDNGILSIYSFIKSSQERAP